MVKKILIAEDESIIALVLKSKLENHGYNICKVTTTGRETIEYALKERPDLLIVDVYLEDDVDGIDAVIKIHQEKFIPVIYISASTDTSTFQKASTTEMVEFIKKPYNEDELIDCIRSVDLMNASRNYPILPPVNGREGRGLVH